MQTPVNNWDLHNVYTFPIIPIYDMHPKNKKRTVCPIIVISYTLYMYKGCTQWFRHVRIFYFCLFACVSTGIDLLRKDILRIRWYTVYMLHALY